MLRRTVSIACVSYVAAQGSELLPQPDMDGVYNSDSDAHHGYTCNEQNLRMSLTKANYDFVQRYGEQQSYCGKNSRRKLDHSDSEQEQANTGTDGENKDDWVAIGAAECATDALPLLCFESVFMRGHEDYLLYIVENAEAVLCCWQMGCPPEDYYLAPASWEEVGFDQTENPFTDDPFWFIPTRRLEEPEAKAAKVAKPAPGLVIRARGDKTSQNSAPSSRDKSARNLESGDEKEENPAQRWARPAWARSASLHASVQQLRGVKADGNRQLDTDEEPHDDQDDDHRYMPSINEKDFSLFWGENGQLVRAFRHNDYDCGNFWQVRTDILTVLDQSPWFYDSFCYVFMAASLTQDIYLSSSVSSFLGPGPGLPRVQSLATNVWAGRKGGEGALSKTTTQTFPWGQGYPDQCRQMPVYEEEDSAEWTYGYDSDLLPENNGGVHGNGGIGSISLCDEGIASRADGTWTAAMLTLKGPMKCCADMAASMNAKLWWHQNKLPVNGPPL